MSRKVNQMDAANHWHDKYQELKGVVGIDADEIRQLRARVASLEETGRLNAEEYIKSQAETTRWAARCGVEKGKREQAEARVAELEALHKAYYNQPFAETCQRAASEERERTLSIVRSVEEEADMDTEHGVGWSQACRSIDNSITKP